MTRLQEFAVAPLGFPFPSRKTQAGQMPREARWEEQQNQWFSLPDRLLHHRGSASPTVITPRGKLYTATPTLTLQQAGHKVLSRFIYTMKG